MNWFYNLKIRTKLLSSFILVALIAGLIGYVGIINIHKIEEELKTMYDHDTKPLGEIADAAVRYQRIRANLREMILIKNVDQLKDIVGRIKEHDKVVDDSLLKYEKTIQSEENRKEYQHLRAAMDKYLPMREKVIALALENKKEEAFNLLMGEAAPVARAVQESTQKLLEMKINVAKKRAEANEITASAAQNLSTGMAVGGVGL
ncbi:MAG: MCP four helix bundle domain-containing protein, partial [Deltaproteobacteria bacterium]|nr:MCP four helix bundle domain-containing protein [Deltaproteobacteria bacterium]